MTKNDLISEIASTGQLAKSDVEHVLDEFSGIITDTLREGGEIAYPGLGKFTKTHRPERQGRNPHSGETITIAAKNVAKFKPAKALTDFLN